MASLDQLQLAWRTIAENRIQSAREQGAFDTLSGFGRPLEDIMDVSDQFGWIRRALRDCREMQQQTANLPAAGTTARCHPW